MAQEAKGDSTAAEKAVEQQAKALGLESADQLEKGISNLLYLVLKKGIPAKDVLQMPDEMIETMYSHAYNMYNQGKYDEAEHLFRFLVILDPTQAKFSFGLAAVAHMRKEYQKAAQIYYMVGLMSPDDPMPHYHASDCYLRSNDITSAIFALDLAVEAAGSNPKYAQVKAKAAMLKEGLEQQLSPEDRKALKEALSVPKPTAEEAEEASKAALRKELRKMPPKRS